MEAPKQRDLGKLLIILVLAALALGYVLLLRPAIVGLWSDDTMYLMGAKSLATGQGYRMLSEPGLLPIIKYPPLLSAVLAPLWLVFQDISQTLLASKLLVITIGLAALWMLYRLGRRFYQLTHLQAASICLLFGSNYIWLRCVTEVLSEPLFLLLSLGLVYVGLRLEKLLDKQAVPPSGKQLAVLVALSCLIFYTRTIGIAFVIGTALWLGKRYGRSSLYAYVGACTILCLGWLWWTMGQPETIEKIQGFYIYPENQTYINEFFFAIIKSHGLLPILQDAASQLPVSALFATFPFLIDVPYLPQAPLWISIATLLILLVGMGYALYRILTAPRTSLLAGSSWCYLVLTFIWYSHGQYPRFILCLVPFVYLVLFGYLKQGLQQTRLPEKVRQMLLILIPLIAIALGLVHPGLSRIPRGETMAMNVPQALWPEYQSAFDAIRTHTQPDDVIWSHYNGLYYFYTHRKVINRNLIPGAETHIDWLAANQYQQFYDVLAETLKRHQVRYIVLEPNFNSDMAVEIPEMAIDILIRSMPKRFKPVYTSPHKMIRIYRVIP